MGAKKKDKEKTEQDPSKAKEKGNVAKAAGGNASKFQMPDPDRTCNVTVPGISAPFALLSQVNETEALDNEAQEDFDYEAAPRKLQLAHITLLKHPVFIGAIDNFFMEDECRSWVEFGERHGFEEAKQKQTAEYAFRDNGRIEMENEEIAHLIWLRMRSFVPDEIPGVNGMRRRAVGCSPRIRLYRYSRGQRFGQHVDGSRDEPSLGGRTHYTVLIYLNGGERDSEEMQIKGGETAFWKDRNGNPTTMVLAFPPTRGVCLFHGHGDECMIHEGAAVEGGAKYVLRTDVVYEKEA
mmetsp:Transcript_90514/g.141915  ORF Transcript_90514/g.141915 Transcript_90514/m.141915 type:complete len:294 (-) Transcript_90514:98-979(-)